MSDTADAKVPEVENAVAPEVKAEEKPSVDVNAQRRAALQAANLKRAELAQQRKETVSVIETKARNMLIRRFGREAVDNALDRRPAGRPTREQDVIRNAHDAACARLTAMKAGGAEVKQEQEQEEEEEDVEVDDEGLDQFATRVVLAHLRRTPSKKRALESAIDTAVQRYIAGMNIPAPAPAPAAAAAAPAPPKAEPRAEPKAAAPAKQRFVFL